MSTESMYKYILNSIKDGVYFVDKDRKLTFWNKSAEDITGFKAAEVLNKHCYDNVLNHIDDHGKELCKKGCPLHQSLQDGKIREASVYLHHKDGQRVPVTVHIMPIIENGEIIGAVESFVDESERAEFLSSMNELKLIAYQDQLTELPNRRYLENYIMGKLADFQSMDIPFALAFFDIDHFKNFNDTYGHDVGDEVLKMVAKIFKALTRQDDIIGRWGGEEFIGVFTGVNQDQLDLILNRIRILIEKSALRTDKEPLQVTISIGGTLVQTNDSMESLVKRADTLLYESKEKGRNCVTIK